MVQPTASYLNHFKEYFKNLNYNSDPYCSAVCSVCPIEKICREYKQNSPEAIKAKKEYIRYHENMEQW